MKNDSASLNNSFDAINSDLKEIAKSLLENFCQLLKETTNIDRIVTRVKNRDSFVEKADKIINNKPKYNKPFQEIQDIIGARIVVFYTSDISPISQKIERAFNLVEKHLLIPEEENEFGYEGLHYVMFLPPHIFGEYRDIPNIPTFFELQVKTLYQHAWAQAEHDLGYKPGMQLDRETKRKLAFVAAQSWGADEILDALHKQIHLGQHNN